MKIDSVESAGPRHSPNCEWRISHLLSPLGLMPFSSPVNLGCLGERCFTEKDNSDARPDFPAAKYNAMTAPDFPADDAA